MVEQELKTTWHIDDGLGSGRRVKVNDNNQMLTKAIEISALQAASENGDAYSWNAVTANLAAGGTALCVVNTSRSKYLVIERIYVWSDVATVLYVHCPAAVTWAGTAVVGANLNRSSSKVAPALAYANESANAFAAANSIISLHTNELATDQFAIDYELKGAVILGYDDAIAVDIVADSAAFNCTIVGYYIDA